MEFVPMQSMFRRVEKDSAQGDVPAFDALIFAGEMALKLTVLGVLAGMEENKYEARHNVEYSLVHADGPGGWRDELRKLLKRSNWPSAPKEVVEDWSALKDGHGPGSWQYKCIADMNWCVKEAWGNRCPALFNSGSLLEWMDGFVYLRVEHAHGTLTPEVKSKIVGSLRDSVECYATNCPVFARSWARLHLDFWGHYRIDPLGGDQDVFSHLRTASENIGDDGVFVWYGQPRLVPLASPGADVDPGDLALPNGGYNKEGAGYNTLCYVHDVHGKTPGYSTPTAKLPRSETAGRDALDVLTPKDQVFTNMPNDNGRWYVERPDLDNELLDRVTDNRNRIITLYGRGGIGKTWSTLHVLRQVASMDRFQLILWFSARDLDLVAAGARSVTPEQLTEAELAKTFVHLIEAKTTPQAPTDRKIMESYLTRSDLGPILFVFDNFETMHNPVTIFNWIELHIQLPNKVLITSRNQSFRGQFEVEVTGMTSEETRKLIQQTGDSLGILPLLKPDYVDKIIKAVEGHPYVVNMVLGEVARTDQPVLPEQFIKASTDILDALFDRTYRTLSQDAKEVFMLIATRGLPVPEMAVEAAVYGSSNPKQRISHPDAAIEELHRSSFIEVSRNEKHQPFVSAPTVAASFGKKKLRAYEEKTSIDQEADFLRLFGPTQPAELSDGWEKSARRLVRNLVELIKENDIHLQHYLEMTEDVATMYSPVWLMLAEVYGEHTRFNNIKQAKEYVKRYLEQVTSAEELDTGWRRLQDVCYKNSEYHSELQAWAEWVQLASTLSDTIMLACSNVRHRISHKYVNISEGVVVEMVRQIAEAAFARMNELDARACADLAYLLGQIKDFPRKEIVLHRAELRSRVGCGSD